MGKLGLRVAKRTIQTSLPVRRAPRPRGQTWATFLRNHAPDIWACDVLPATDLLFRPVYACFVNALGTRRVVQVGVTRHPTDAWVAQQLREATPFEQRPRCLIRDNDRNYGPAFAGVATASGSTILRTPYRAPRANAVCERFLGSVRFDHLLVLGKRHLARVLREHVAYFNRERPHQALAHATPEPRHDSRPTGAPAPRWLASSEPAPPPGRTCWRCRAGADRLMAVRWRRGDRVSPAPRRRCGAGRSDRRAAVEIRCRNVPGVRGAAHGGARWGGRGGHLHRRLPDR